MNIFLRAAEYNVKGDDHVDVYIWSGSGSRAGIRYGVDAPPIFFAACEDEIESEIADLKAAGKRIIRVEKKEDLERKISFA